jgi:hypothetical protein
MYYENKIKVLYMAETSEIMGRMIIESEDSRGISHQCGIQNIE